MIEPLKKDLIHFLAVSDCGNYSKAADFLSVKQSTISKSVLKLEQELRQKLFIRGSRYVRLTEVGEIYYQQAKVLQKGWKEANQYANDLNSVISGNFQFGCHPVIAKNILPKTMSALGKHGAINLQIQLMTSRECVEAVKLSKLDFCVAASPLLYPDLVIKKLWKESIGLYSKTGKLTEHMIFHEDMLHLQGILKNYSSVRRTLINNYEIIHSVLLESKLHMGFLPDKVAEADSKLKLVKSFNKNVDICLVYRSDRMKTKGFKECIKAIASNSRV